MIAQALTILRPNAQWRLADEPKNSFEYSQFLEWYESDIPPTWDEVKSTEQQILLNFTSVEYQRKRAAEYPPIGDQLDALFHAGVFPTEMAALVQAVKDKYPKV
jgi:hypothetical protein